MSVLSVVMILCCNQLMNISSLKRPGSPSGVPCLRMAMWPMGMQESYMAPGWYNGIHDVTYLESEGIKEVMIPLFQDMIAYRIEEFKQNPGYMAWFYYHKLASQWNNPSFRASGLVKFQKHRPQCPSGSPPYTRGSFCGKLDWYLNELHMLILFGNFAVSVPQLEKNGDQGASSGYLFLRRISVPFILGGQMPVYSGIFPGTFALQRRRILCSF